MTTDHISTSIGSDTSQGVVCARVIVLVNPSDSYCSISFLSQLLPSFFSRSPVFSIALLPASTCMVLSSQLVLCMCQLAI